jgi:hypothetical protein
VKNRKRFWTILGAIAVAGAGAAYWQRGNIKAAIYYFGNSKEEIAEKLTENERIAAEALEKLPNQPIKDLTEEEKEKLASQEISEEEAIKIILNKSAPAVSATPSETNATVPAQTPAPSSSVKTPEPSENLKTPVPSANEKPSPTPGGSEQKVTEIVAEIYVLRAHYTDALEAMRLAAIDEYLAIAKEQRTAAVKQEFAVKYIKLAGALEAECDAKMDDAVSKLEKELKTSGGDLSVIDDVKFTYANEKSLKKAYYLNMFNN